MREVPPNLSDRERHSGDADRGSFRGVTRLVRASAYCYFVHILLIVKIALLYHFAFFSLFALAWAIVRREARFSWHPLYFPLIAYAFVSTTSALMAGQRIHAYGEIMLWFKILIFPGAVILYRTLPWLKDRMLYAYGILGTGMAIWALIEFVFLDRRDLEHRINGPVSHVMTFSNILLPVALMMLILWIHQRKSWQLIATIITSAALLLTFTRSVWIGWIAAAFVVALFSRARLVLYAMPAVILFVTFLPLSLFGRLVSTFDLRQSSNFDRIRMLQAGVEMIRDSPLLGVGPANVKEVYAIYRKPDAPRPRPPHLHNNVVQLWAERGVLGLATYLLLLAMFFRQCAAGWKTPEQRMWAEMGVACVVSLTVAGFFEFNFGDTEVFYLLLNLMALVTVALEQTERRSNEVAGVLVPATT